MLRNIFCFNCFIGIKPLASLFKHNFDQRVLNSSSHWILTNIKRSTESWVGFFVYFSFQRVQHTFMYFQFLFKEKKKQNNTVITTPNLNSLKTNHPTPPKLSDLKTGTVFALGKKSLIALLLIYLYKALWRSKRSHSDSCIFMPMASRKNGLQGNCSVNP